MCTPRVCFALMSAERPLLHAWVERKLKGQPGGLAEVWRAPIAAMFDASELDENDVVTEESDREAARIVWTAVLDTVVAKIEAAKGPKPSPIAYAKALACVLVPVTSKHCPCPRKHF